MITFYETYYGQDKVYLILDNGKQIGQLKLDNISRVYGEKAILSNLGVNVDESKLHEILSTIINRFNLNINNTQDNGSTVILY